jgi:GNAT superfamily N-acetyltransferase
MELMIRGELRQLTSDDLTHAMELPRLAGWNQTLDDWKMLLRLEPQGCFAIAVDEQIVATTTLIRYGTRLAWIGMVLTRPEYRRMGLAKRLMERVLAQASEQKISSVMLDATAEGQPLYEKLGFKTEQIVERWFREGDAAARLEDETSAGAIPFSKKMDLEAFGADRSLLLEELEKRNPSHGLSDAYCFSREGTRRRFLGPCVAADPANARIVIEQTLREGSASGWFWDLLVANENAVRLAKEFGFTPQRRLERMVLGERLPKKDEMVYAISGFELG